MGHGLCVQRPQPRCARPSVGDADLLGPLDGPGLQRAVPHQPGQGPDRPVGGVRPAHPDSATTPTTRRRPARSARSASPSPTSATWRQLMDGIPLERMNTSMTINATAAWLLALYVAHAEETGVDPSALDRHDAERHRQGVPVPGHLHLRPGGQPPADRRHHRLDGAPRAPVEPDQRVQLPPPGGGGDAGPGAGLRPGHRDRRPRRGPRVRPGRPRRASRRWWGGSRSSATPASASWRRSARCGRSPPCGTASAPSGTA